MDFMMDNEALLKARSVMNEAEVPMEGRTVMFFYEGELFECDQSSSQEVKDKLSKFLDLTSLPNQD